MGSVYFVGKVRWAGWWRGLEVNRGGVEVDVEVAGGGVDVDVDPGEWIPKARTRSKLNVEVEAMLVDEMRCDELVCW